jgi:hypothetical protein
LPFDSTFTRRNLPSAPQSLVYHKHEW